MSAMFDWRKLTEDPCNAEVALVYRKYLLSLRHFEVIHRDDYILRECAGKTVMDIGSCEHTEEYMRNANWFFKKILKVAKKVVGVDVNQKLIPIAQKLGYDIRYADATGPADFNEKFDLIHAGDVIEHITNAGGFLRFVKRHLNPGGRVILSTPNPFFKGHFFSVFRKGTLTPNFEHTCWVTPTCMNELAYREGFEFEKICYPIKPSSGRKWMVYFKPARRWIETFSGEYIFILKNPDKN